MQTEWLLLIPQLPSSPSSLRVTVWRRMRGAGAVSLHHGVWIMPRTPDQEQTARALLAEVNAAGGSGLLLVASALAGGDEDAIKERFRADRDQEYGELCQGCRHLLNEIAQETAQGKFDFAELEEIEEDCQKLATWLQRIRARDFFGGHRADEAGLAVAGCQTACEGFTRAVYGAQGIVANEHADS